MLDSFSPSGCAASTSDMLCFNSAQVSICSCQLSTFTFTLPFGHQLLFGRQIFTKFLEGQENTQQITQ
jgi:hypothetical protein